MKICPVAEYCGGCQYQGIDYPSQLENKQKYVESLLSNFHCVEKIIGMTDPDNYRNRMQISFAYDEYHNVISGYYVPSSHTIVPVNSCMLCDEDINRIYISVKKILAKYKISVFNERSMKGCIRHLLIRSTNLNEFMVVLVAGTSRINSQDQIINDIIRFNPEVKTIVLNINNRHTSSVLGDRNINLFGKGYITDELCDLKFKISPNSFYQVNRRQTEILYDTAIKMADLKKTDVVIDAYCGTGTIGMYASRYVEKVIGIESNQSAVNDAINNKKINGIKNIEFYCEDAGIYMNRLAEKGSHIDAVIMDPPRSGSSSKFIFSVNKLLPEKVIYISCNPETLKRDLKHLTSRYIISRIQPVDMFPYTSHVECIVCMQRKDR